MTVVKLSENLAPHPSVEGWVLGWAVLACTRTEWHLVAVYKEQSKAEEEAGQLGAPYGAAWGAHRLGSSDFMHESEFDCSALPLVA